jgi:hypothetical protein
MIGCRAYAQHFWLVVIEAGFERKKNIPTSFIRPAFAYKKPADVKAGSCCG